MRKKRFSVEQMIGVLKQTQAGVPVAEVIRKEGISEETSYLYLPVVRPGAAGARIPNNRQPDAYCCLSNQNTGSFIRPYAATPFVAHYSWSALLLRRVSPGS